MSVVQSPIHVLFCRIFRGTRQVRLQGFPPDLQDIQPCPSQVWNCDNIRLYPNCNWNNMVCTYNFFIGDRLWRTQTGKRAPFWGTSLIFTCDVGQCFIPPGVVQHITHYTQDINHNIPSDWVVHN